MIVEAEEGRATLGRRRAANQQTKQLLRVVIGDGANARKEDMVKLAESQKVLPFVKLKTLLVLNESVLQQSNERRFSS
ncbi:hypothetical protein PI126_g22310 [Phytophthora idaei]|nr:hypothetical protein PI126_g22310 [Phytophthora idaei]